FQPPDVGASDAGVQDVAHDAYLDAFEPTEVVTDREHVEEGLRGVLVPPIAGIDHVRGDALRQELRRARGRVPDHDHVDPHRLQIARRVDQRLALLQARAVARHVDRVRAQPLLRELEGDARAGRRLEEEVDDRLAAQDRDLLDRPLADLLERLGRVQDRADLRGRELLEADQVLAEVGVRLAHPSTSGAESSTASRPSSSGTSTSTRSPGSTSTVRPTMSGWI